jgi:cytochrome c-type biogenesis protein
VIFAASQVDVTVFAAFAAGALSFISPCVLPLVPGYLSAISVAKPGEDESAEKRMGPAFIFCLSFTAIFVALGLFATGLSAPLKDERGTLEEIAGVLLIVFGLFLIVTPFIDRFNRDLRSDKLMERAGTGGPIIAGAAFAIAWTPCTGPILGAILTTAAARDGFGGGAFLLLAYSLGLAVPFLLSALAFERVTGAFKFVRDHYKVINIFSGVLLVIIGILVFNHEMTRLAGDARDLLDSLGLSPLVNWAER